MKFVITTYRNNPDRPGSFILIKEKRCGTLLAALEVWIKAMGDFTVDRIRVEVEKR